MSKKVKIQWPFVAVMGLVFSLAPFAIDMYLPALPTMAVDMATSIDNIEASVAVFLLGYAIAQLVLGPLADRLDHSKMLFAGVAVFTLASLFMPLASTPLQL